MCLMYLMAHTVCMISYDWHSPQKEVEVSCRQLGRMMYMNIHWNSLQVEIVVMMVNVASE